MKDADQLFEAESEMRGRLTLAQNNPVGREEILSSILDSIDAHKVHYKFLCNVFYLFY
jgi:hypothetical protein